MRRYRGYGPFLPPDSNEYATPPVENDAAKTMDFFSQQHADVIDNLVRLLSSEEGAAASNEELEKVTKDLDEDVLDADSLPFALLLAFAEELALQEQEESASLNDIKMEVDPPPDTRGIVEPPTSETSGHASGSGSSPSTSIKAIKKEKSLEDINHVDDDMPLHSIKEEDHNEKAVEKNAPQNEKVVEKNTPQNDSVLLGEQENRISNELRLPPEVRSTVIEFALSTELTEDWAVYVFMKHYQYQYPEEWESGKYEPGPQLELCDLAYALAELENQLELEDDKKIVKVERSPEVEDHEDQAEQSEDEYEQSGDEIDLSEDEDNYRNDEGYPGETNRAL